MFDAFNSWWPNKGRAGNKGGVVGNKELYEISHLPVIGAGGPACWEPSLARAGPMQSGPGDGPARRLGGWEGGGELENAFLVGNIEKINIAVSG